MKRWKKILFIVVIVIGILSGVFFFYTADYYRAEDVALDQYENLLAMGDIKVDGNLVTYIPELASETGIIFYPGAKVEEIAYTPILNKLREEGYTCVMVKMPFHMAIFDSNAADDVLLAYPEIESWYICGHSMGGAMASDYMSKNPKNVEGLILLGAYIYGDVSSKDAVTIYGTFNSNLEEYIDYTDNIVIIEGGNHAQFGNYGLQKGDPEATITPDEQQGIAVKVIVDFINNRE